MVFEDLNIIWEVDENWLQWRQNMTPRSSSRPLPEIPKISLFNMESPFQLELRDCFVSTNFYEGKLLDVEGKEDPKFASDLGLANLYCFSSIVPNLNFVILINSSFRNFSSLRHNPILIPNLYCWGCYFEKFWIRVIKIVPGNKFYFLESRLMN